MVDYKDYIEFKGWKNLFNYTSDENWQFEKIVENYDIFEKKILEIGYGRGSFMQFLNDKGADIFGSEIQNVLLDAGKLKGYSVTDNIETLQKHSYDLVFALDVFEHMTEFELTEYLKNIGTLLKKGGILVARFPNCQSPASLYNQYGDYTHKIHLSEPIFKYYLEKQKFKFIETRTGNSANEYNKNLIKQYLKLIIKRICEKIVKIALGFSNNSLDANIIIYALKT